MRPPGCKLQTLPLHARNGSHSSSITWLEVLVPACESNGFYVYVLCVMTCVGSCCGQDPKYDLDQYSGPVARTLDPTASVEPNPGKGTKAARAWQPGCPGLRRNAVVGVSCRGPACQSVGKDVIFNGQLVCKRGAIAQSTLSHS